MKTKNPAVPQDIETLKRDWWKMKSEIRIKNQVNNELKRKLEHYINIAQLADGLLNLLDSPQKREVPGLFESVKARLSAELQLAHAGMRITRASGE
jgi:hypothetical protein